MSPKVVKISKISSSLFRRKACYMGVTEIAAYSLLRRHEIEIVLFQYATWNYMTLMHSSARNTFIKQSK